MRSGVGAFWKGSRFEWRDFLLDFFFFEDAVVVLADDFALAGDDLDEPDEPEELALACCGCK